jgi:hypothetical protein
MAMQGRWGYSGSLAIPHRSACYGRRDLVTGEFVVLEREKENNCIREMREIILGEMVQRGIKGRLELTIIIADD